MGATLGRRDVFRTQLKTFPEQDINRFLFACQVIPFAGNSLEVLRIFAQQFNRVVFGVHHESYDFKVLFIFICFLHFQHVLIHDGANAGATGKERVKSLNLALQPATVSAEN